jgi:FCD domain-containing protein
VRAARRRTEAQKRALLAALELTRKAGETRDVDAYFHENEGFHQAIYAASQNEFLIEQTLSLQRRLRPYRRLQLLVRDRMSSSQAEHEAIAAAIIAGEADLAAEHIRGHVVIQGERFGDLVASLAEWRATAELANDELPAKARARAAVPGSQPRPGSIIARSTAHRPETAATARISRHGREGISYPLDERPPRERFGEPSPVPA